MKSILLTGALAFGAFLIPSLASAQLSPGISDQLSITNTGNPTGVFVGNFSFTEATEGSASSAISRRSRKPPYH